MQGSLNSETICTSPLLGTFDLINLETDSNWKSSETKPIVRHKELRKDLYKMPIEQSSKGRVLERKEKTFKLSRVSSTYVAISVSLGKPFAWAGGETSIPIS